MSHDERPGNAQALELETGSQGPRQSESKRARWLVLLGSGIIQIPIWGTVHLGARPRIQLTSTQDSL